MHVRIAWEIHNHQQKGKAESRLPGSGAGHSPAGSHASGGGGNNKLSLPPGGVGAADYLGGTKQRADLLYGGALGRLVTGPPPPNPFDPLGSAGRSPYSAAARGFYGPSPLGKACTTVYQHIPTYLICFMSF